jgi:hypothetical protein
MLINKAGGAAMLYLSNFLKSQLFLIFFVIVFVYLAVKTPSYETYSLLRCEFDVAYLVRVDGLELYVKIIQFVHH